MRATSLKKQAEVKEAEVESIERMQKLVITKC